MGRLLLAAGLLCGAAGGAESAREEAVRLLIAHPPAPGTPLVVDYRGLRLRAGWVGASAEGVVLSAGGTRLGLRWEELGGRALLRLLLEAAGGDEGMLLAAARLAAGLGEEEELRRIRSLLAGKGLEMPQARRETPPAGRHGEGEEGGRKDPARRVRFGAGTLLADDERTHYSRAVNFAPGDGEEVSLNPPRFRWRYHPERPGEGGDHVFLFQVARDRDFGEVVFQVETEFNFYNTLGPLPGRGPFYWRVGYRRRGEEGPPRTWSRVRRFTVAADALVWDRSLLARPDFASLGHPRILFNRRTLPRLRRLVESDPESRAVYRNMLAEAEGILRSPWWDRVPESDREPAVEKYLTMARGLALVAFVWRLSGEERFSGVKERALRMARYPKGGRASPEGAGGESNEDSTQITEFLGLLYDWLYEYLEEEERRDFLHSLRWRIDHFLNHFAWRKERGGRLVVHGGSLATTGASHAFEGFFDTFPAALSCYEEAEVARTAFHLGVNYMVGVGSAHGFDEGWNEGPGYGNSKLAWLTNAACYLDSVFPGFQVGRNPWFRRLGQFFRLQTPVGLEHAPWGHGSNRRGYYEHGHFRSYRKLAFLTGDGRFLANWIHYGGNVDRPLYRPWIECALPLWRRRPEPVLAEDTVVLFPRAGWVMAMSGPPSDPATYRRGVGIVFCCRPRGAYSHAFCCENSFHLFGYGHDLSHAAGSGDYEPHAFHSMSHNTILVDGLGQAQPARGQPLPYYGRIIAFGEEAPYAAYWCGDATLAYPRRPLEVRHWWGRLSDVYRSRALPHLRRVNRHVLFLRRKYFVLLDDLAAGRPARWSWLYHVLRAEEMELDRRSGSFRYRVGEVEVHVFHLLGSGALEVEDRQGERGFRNPLTGEDYTDDRGRARGRRRLVARHNLWLTTARPHRNWRFLCVIYPVAPGAPRPEVERLGPLTFAVRAGPERDVVSFEGARADVAVDLAAIAPAGYHPAAGGD